MTLPLKMKELKMRNTKEMLQDITDAMNRAGELATFSEDATEKQKAFYGMVSEPLQLSSDCDENRVLNIVSTAMIDAVDAIAHATPNANYSFSFDRYNCKSTATTTKGDFKLKLYKQMDNSRNSEVFCEVVEIPRAVKHTKTLSIFIETIIDKIKKDKKLSIDFDFDNERFKEAWLQYRVKLLANEIKANTGSMWMYFTDNNYYEHYKALSDTQSLHSCMAYTPEHYGSLINGTYIHPLQGYDYTPDFRLGLVSTYSPNEIDDVTEYPFIARAVVSYSDHDTPKLMYGKSYGNEKACNLIKNCLHNGKPTGRIFYAIKANHLHSDARNPDECDYNLQDYYNDGHTENDDNTYYKEDDDILGHFVAPFIDPWANLFDHGGQVKRHPITGLEVLNCMVIGDEWYEDEEDRQIYVEGYSIYHGSGIVRPRADDGETYSALILTSDGLEHL